MSTFNKAKQVIDRLVGEAYTPYTPEFVDLLALFRGIRKCETIGDGEACATLVDNYASKHGDDLVGHLYRYTNSTRMATDDYFADILQDLNLLATKAIRSGKLETGVDAAEAIAALADASGY